MRFVSKWQCLLSCLPTGLKETALMSQPHTCIIKVGIIKVDVITYFNRKIK